MNHRSFFFIATAFLLCLAARSGVAMTPEIQKEYDAIVERYEKSPKTQKDANRCMAALEAFLTKYDGKLSSVDNAEIGSYSLHNLIQAEGDAPSQTPLPKDAAAGSLSLEHEDELNLAVDRLIVAKTKGDVEHYLDEIESCLAKYKSEMSALDELRIGERLSFATNLPPPSAGVAGLGFTKVKGKCVVVRYNEPSPGREAGVRKGDVITAVDGTDVRRLCQAEIGRSLGGDPGTAVELTVERPGQAEPLKFTVTRRAR